MRTGTPLNSGPGRAFCGPGAGGFPNVLRAGGPARTQLCCSLGRQRRPGTCAMVRAGEGRREQGLHSTCGKFGGGGHADRGRGGGRGRNLRGLRGGPDDGLPPTARASRLPATRWPATRSSSAHALSAVLPGPVKEAQNLSRKAKMRTGAGAGAGVLGGVGGLYALQDALHCRIEARRHSAQHLCQQVNLPRTTHRPVTPCAAIGRHSEADRRHAD